MSRPPGPQADTVTDASLVAHTGGVIERRFAAEQMPRIGDAGVAAPAEVRMTVRCSIVEDRVALDGELTGSVTMTCQRCMKPVAVELEDQFALIVVDEDAEPANDIVGYEPVVADAARLDLQWLAEEQTLLALPLVPKHDNENCAAVDLVTQAEVEELGRQRPFANLKEMLRDR